MPPCGTLLGSMHPINVCFNAELFDTGCKLVAGRSAGSRVGVLRAATAAVTAWASRQLPIHARTLPVYRLRQEHQRHGDPGWSSRHPSRPRQRVQSDTRNGGRNPRLVHHHPGTPLQCFAETSG